MKYFYKIIFALLILVLFNNISNAYTRQSKDSIKVTINIKTTALPEDSIIFITGNQPQMGYWRPDSIKMNYIGHNKWSKTIYLKGSASVEYKFTLGSWGREGSNPDGSPLPNFIINISTDTVVNDTILYWTKAAEKLIKGQVTGNLEHHYSLRSKGLRERDIVIWLPPDYGTKNKRFPVIYMQDGQNLFDPATSTFGIDWQIDESADSLIKNKLIRSVIVVGIYNTQDRSREYTPGDTGSIYMRFVVNELKPFIDSLYLTLPDRDNTFTGGSSAGGIISFMLAWEYPEIFSGAICMSPAFKISHIDYVSTVHNYNGAYKDLKFYIDNGGIALETSLQPGIDEMITELRSRGYKQGKDFLYTVYPEAQHNEAAWALRIPEALKFILNKK